MTIPEMLPPKGNWSWCSGAITHYNMPKDLIRSIKAVTRAISQKKFVPSYVNLNTTDHDKSWRDNESGLFLSKKAERLWEVPGKLFFLGCHRLLNDKFNR